MRKYLSIISAKTKLRCLCAIGLAFISSILASIWPVKLGELITGISNGSVPTITLGLRAIITFGLIYLTSECLNIARRVFLDYTIAKHESEVRKKSIEKLLKMPVSYYFECPSGEKTAQLNQGVAGFSQLIKIMCNDVFATILVAVCTLVQVFINAPKIMVVVMLFYLGFSVIISWFQIRSQNGIREKIVNQKNALDGQICQSISNVELIRGMNAERYETNRLSPHVMDICRTEIKHHLYMGTFDSVKQTCKVLFHVVLLLICVVQLANNHMSAGVVITVFLLFQQLIKPIDEVYRFMDETASSVIKAKALIEVTSSPSDEVFNVKSSEKTVSGNEIHIEDLLVTNPQKDVNLAWYENVDIPSVGVTALCGPNGSGKTSLIRCLKKYYPHTKGKISMFGRDQETYDQKELADVIYYTPQTSFFFNGTVRENLLYGIERPVNEEELIDALQNVHLVGNNHGDTTIHSDPKNALEFIIGEKADELSGGMKQRLSLARAFLRRPKLFVFDEITANLDPPSTNYVLGRIETYAKSIGAGVVYISHDQKVVNRCNKVVTLKNKLKEDVCKAASA